MKLARLHRAGELTKVHIPGEMDESVRGVIRCRETIVKEVKRSKQYITSFLQCRGIVYREGNLWTKRHREHLRRVKLEEPDATTLGRYIRLLEMKEVELADVELQVEYLAKSERYKRAVGIMCCFKGIATVSAMTLISEVQDFKRFGGPRQLMAYWGLTPSEHSSGEIRRQGGITKAGSARCRTILVEAAWHYRAKPSLGGALKARQKNQPTEAIKHAWKAQYRLHDKYWRIALRKGPCKAVVATAREFVGFIWAVMTQLEECPTS
jgi:transposase